MGRPSGLPHWLFTFLQPTGTLPTSRRPWMSYEGMHLPTEIPRVCIGNYIKLCEDCMHPSQGRTTTGSGYLQQLLWRCRYCFQCRCKYGWFSTLNSTPCEDSHGNRRGNAHVHRRANGFFTHATCRQHRPAGCSSFMEHIHHNDNVFDGRDNLGLDGCLACGWNSGVFPWQMLILYIVVKHVRTATTHSNLLARPYSDNNGNNSNNSNNNNNNKYYF